MRKTQDIKRRIYILYFTENYMRYPNTL